MDGWLENEIFRMKMYQNFGNENVSNWLDKFLMLKRLKKFNNLNKQQQNWREESFALSLCGLNSRAWRPFARETLKGERLIELFGQFQPVNLSRFFWYSLKNQSD